MMLGEPGVKCSNWEKSNEFSSNFGRGNRCNFGVTRLCS